MTTTAQPSPPTELRAKLAQLMCVRIGSNLSPIRTVEEDEAAIRDLVERHPIGGLLLFNGCWPETPAVLARLQDASRYPLLVCADVERGVGQQVRGLPMFPHAMAFDQLGDEAESAVEKFAQIMAREARACGIQVALAPVADVNSDPRNPIIATRAFSQDPARAARLAAAFVRTAESAGLLTCAKHFPGHGNTHQDSHESLPIVDRSRAELEACDLPPFRAAIAAGTSFVMSAHVAYPQLDATGCPATLSAPIMTDLLGREHGFQGVVCCDSLLMAGVRDRFETEGELALATLRAGVDYLLDVADVDAAVDYLIAAVERGELAESRVDEALARLWQVKRGLASGGNGLSPDQIANADTSAAGVARRAVTVLDGVHVPLDTARPLTCVIVGPAQPYRRPEDNVFEAALRRHFADLSYAEIVPEADAELMAAVTRQAVAAEQLVIAIVVKPAAWHRFGLTAGQVQLVQTCTGERPTVVASLGVPQVLDRFPAATARLCTFSDVPVSLRALANVLAGVP